MKKKIISLLLGCFIFVSSSISCFADSKNKMVDGGLITVPIIATLITVGVGTGLVIKNNDEIYNTGKLFSDYLGESGIDYNVFQESFKSSCLINNGIVTVGKDVLDVFNDFFSSKFETEEKIQHEGYNYDKYGTISSNGYIGSVPVYDIPNNGMINFNPPYATRGIYILDKVLSKSDFSVSPFTFKFVKTNGSYWNVYDLYYEDSLIYSNLWVTTQKTSSVYENYIKIFRISNQYYFYIGSSNYYTIPSTDVMSFPGGVVEWDNYIEGNKSENGSIALPMPGTLGDVLNKNPSDVWNGTYENGLSIDGVVTIPNVSNPSINVAEDVFISGAVDVPGVDVPGVDVPGLEFPNFGDSIDFSPLELSGITERFPFSLPWDFARLIGSLDVATRSIKAPVFEVPIVSEKITVDLNYFNEWANIVRWFITISFITTLIYISVRLKG